jgi:hypothetical protein
VSSLSCLESVRSVADAPLFIKVMGFRPAFDEIPIDDWLGVSTPEPDITRAARVSSPTEFPWYAVEARNPLRAARRICTVLSRRGEVAAVMAIDSANLAVAVAFEDIPVAAFQRGNHSALERSQLNNLVGCLETTHLGTAARIARILATESVGHRFFCAFEAAYVQVVDSMAPTVPIRDRRHVALLQLTRILFLYFVQAKGWLDGREDFLRTEVDRCLASKRSVQRHLLHPLFFGTLNRPVGVRSASARHYGRIPFLNGGLFEPHFLERRHKLVIANPSWRDVFDDLFERYRFTVAEGTDQHTIAPDMLGRVFEGLMQSGERKSTGSYYTPASLVDELLHHSFGAFAAKRTGIDCARATAMIRERSPDLRELWTDITVLDPAAGSGAFLLGALTLLAELRFGKRANTSAARRRILKHHLFGVDKDPMAVRLAELRLWLAIVAVEEDGPSTRVRPLPNLDCLVRQGDSLRDPLGAAYGSRLSPDIDAYAHAKLRRQVFESHSTTKTTRARKLRTAELKATRTCLVNAEDRLRDMLAECRAQAADRSLFGERRGPDRQIRKRVRRVRDGLRTVQRHRRKLDREGSLPWFHFEGHFGDVFVRGGGFDLVVGNPPWVRAEELGRDERRHLRERYAWWRGGSGTGYKHQPDLAVAFLERGLELAAPDGVLGFLVPAKFLKTGYATTARDRLAHTTTLYVLADLTDAHGTSFGATTYPLAIVAAKSAPPDDHEVKTDLGSQPTGAVAQRRLRRASRWSLGSDASQAVVDKMEQYPRIEESLACHLGVKTGANRVFLQIPAAVTEGPLLRRAVRGRDVGAWRVAEGIPMLWPCHEDGRPLERVPATVKRHFDRHAHVLRARADFHGGVLWQLFRTGPACSVHRVIWADLARRLEAVPLTDAADRDIIPLNSCYLVAVPSAAQAVALAAWLNSSPIRSLARRTADVARGGYARFNAAVVGGLPLPTGVLDDQTLHNLGRRALAGVAVQGALDQHVAHHLKLGGSDRQALELLD